MQSSASGRAPPPKAFLRVRRWVGGIGVGGRFGSRSSAVSSSSLGLLKGRQREAQRRDRVPWGAMVVSDEQKAEESQENAAQDQAESQVVTLAGGWAVALPLLLSGARQPGGSALLIQGTTVHHEHHLESEAHTDSREVYIQTVQGKKARGMWKYERGENLQVWRFRVSEKALGVGGLKC